MSKRVVVVGGGVVGLASAYRLAAAGADVVVVESGAAGQAASHGNAAKIALAESAPVPAPGMIIQGLRWMLKPDSPLYVRPSLAPAHVRFLLRMARYCTATDFRRGLEATLRLAEGANDLLDEWTRDGLSFESHQAGALLAFESRERFDEQTGSLEIFEAFGHVPERLHGDAVQDKEPALSPAFRHGLFFPADRQIEPDSLTRALVKRCHELGAEVLEHTAAQEVLRSGDRVVGVRTASREISCDAVVLAAGVWSGLLASRLGVALPIRPGKGYSVDYAPGPVSLRTSLTLEDARVAVTPLDGKVRLAGTMEFGGFDLRIDPRRVEAIRRAATRAFPEWGEPQGGEPWAGLRPMTPDGLPVIGQLPSLHNAFVASGHGMLGLTLAANTAEIVVEMVLRDRTPLVAEPFSPRRFTR
jgi:D-amino-acid dehydrogenase